MRDDRPVEVQVEALGARRFRVRVHDGAGETAHEVTVPRRLEGGPDLDDEDLEHVVRESFHFLLRHEAASSILTRFSLDDITRYFPEYPDELSRRLGT
ncbi:MAG: hypothetical protein ACRDXC_10495 [Acidimicrobiales bacterium]